VASKEQAHLRRAQDLKSSVSGWQAWWALMFLHDAPGTAVNLG